MVKQSLLSVLLRRQSEAGGLQMPQQLQGIHAMKVLKKAIVASAVLASTMLGTSAHAATFLTLSGPSGTFGDDEVICVETSAPCTFNRTFLFSTAPGVILTSINISSVATSAINDIGFSSVTFNGVEFNILSEGTQEFRNLLNQSMRIGSLNELSVAGTTGGNSAFSGNISFSSVAAVPEPTTWMLMLMGMAGIGFSMRRKKDTTLRVRYA